MRTERGKGRVMSFRLTARQVRDRSKMVTRRFGWPRLKVGQELQAVVQGQGLRKGEHGERLHCIRVRAVRREPLDAIMRLPYAEGRAECAREGFPELTPTQFVVMFMRENCCGPGEEVARIEFEYLD